MKNIVFIAALVLICAGFAGVHIYCTKQSAAVHSYFFTERTMHIPQEGISVSVTVSKQWRDTALQPEMPVGAQYDGVLLNNTRYAFTDWSAEFIFSDTLKIDSSWNGFFSSSGRRLSYTASDGTAEVEPYTSGTFGAVLYASSLMTVSECTIHGRRIIRYRDTAAFWILCACAVAWFFALAVDLLIQSRTKFYRNQAELDSRIIMQTMNTLTNFIDAKDTYTRGHSTRVAEYSAEIARRMKIHPDQIPHLYYIALMHDCGKIAIPDSVLKKPGILTAEEYELIQNHTTTGSDLLQNFTAIPEIRNGAHFHHERFDGTGYPDGLAGKDIPLAARIICVADSFDAMNSNRCYRPGLSMEKIIDELIQNSGKQFDPEIVPFMIDMIEEGFVAHIQAKYPIAPAAE